MATIRSLRVMMYVDHSKVDQGMRAVERKVAGGANRINRTLVASLGAGFVGLGASLFRSLQVAARRQKLEVSAAVLGGTDSLWKDLNNRAANSSIASDEWLSGANRLLGAGVAVDDIMGLMESLANVSAGTGSSIRELGLVYSQVFAKGKLQGEEMLQFMERNINLMPALQKHLGKSASEIKKMQAEGKILADDVAKALEIMTRGDGRFAGMDAAQLKTLAGSIQYLVNRMNYGFERVGKTLTPITTVLAREIGYWLGPGGPIAVGLDMIAATLSVIMVPVGGILALFRWIDYITIGWASTLLAGAALIAGVLALMLLLGGAVQVAMGSAMIATWIAGITAFGMQVVSVFGIIAAWLSTLTGLSIAWASALTLGIVPVILFIAWVIRGIYRGLTEDLRKEQKKAEDAKRKLETLDKRERSGGALFSTSSAYEIISGTLQDNEIQLAQLAMLEQIATNTTEEERFNEKVQEIYDQRPNREFLGMKFHVTGDTSFAQFQALNSK